MTVGVEVRIKQLLTMASTGLLLQFCAPSALALDSQWYFGIGGGLSILEPNPDLPGLNVDDNQGTTGSLIFGRDLDKLSSIQLQLYSLGEATLTDTQTVSYAGGDVSILYRFYDNRDGKLDRGVVGASLYGRFGLGFADRSNDVAIDNQQEIYFGFGAGAEVYLSRNIALRAEAFYHDQDFVSAQLALVTRFGGAASQQLRAPQLPSPGVQEELPEATAAQRPQATVPTTPAQIPEANEPEELTASAIVDTDGDGIPNTLDKCSNSVKGYPVRDDGCPLFDGVISGVQFLDGTSELAADATVQLDYLANLLKQYPNARVELLAHTDSRGDLREQSILTRARLRTVGTYLIGRGISASRMVLRSFGGSRPLYDNATAQGRQRNNRIEVIEHHTTP